MKKFNRIALAVLFLAAGAAGLRAEPADYAFALLPVLGPEMNGVVVKVSLAAVVIDSDGKNLGIPMQLAVWNADAKGGAWQNQRGNAISRLLFPVKALEGAANLKVRVNQEISHQPPYGGSSPSVLKTLQTLPLAAGEPGTAIPFPYDLITIDASSVTWATEKKGVAAIMYQIAEGAAPARKVAGALKFNGQKTAALLASKESAITPTITFVCYGGRKINWSGNGTDLRKSGLTVTLAGDPGCSN